MYQCSDQACSRDTGCMSSSLEQIPKHMTPGVREELHHPFTIKQFTHSSLLS